MSREIHVTKSGTTAIYISADWSQASSMIMVKYSDCGEKTEWETSDKQVADFRHNPQDALDHFITVDDCPPGRQFHEFLEKALEKACGLGGCSVGYIHNER